MTSFDNLRQEPHNTPGKRITVKTEGQPDYVVVVMSSVVNSKGGETTTWKREDNGEIETRDVWFTVGEDEV